ncbi:hypothetical protein B0T16DRAFT_462299 [Cercophora newfieldiana]|uniref:Uncharacterized protein n=1 Tax=Cercophora newfieldiana TaxID=92897 RepID=A0AA40CHD8_9PEZI|nr:hypothetical protein B0T16DRAFT_462299 [Cercophora newfieldiana]
MSTSAGETTPSAETPTPTPTPASASASASASSSQTSAKQKRHKARALTRDEIIEVRALKKYAKWTHDQIVAATGFTINQVQSACKAPRYPKKPDRWTVAGGGTGGRASVGAGRGTAEGAGSGEGEGMVE